MGHPWLLKASLFLFPWRPGCLRSRGVQMAFIAKNRGWSSFMTPLLKTWLHSILMSSTTVFTHIRMLVAFLAFAESTRKELLSFFHFDLALPPSCLRRVAKHSSPHLSALSSHKITINPSSGSFMALWGFDSKSPWS